MKDMHFITIRLLRVIALLSAAALLVQCSMPSRQAWQYIQTNGLLTYWRYEARHHSSPPFGTSRTTQQYASSRGYSSGHRTLRPTSTWSGFWGSGMPNRIPYRSSYSSSSTYNRYYSTTPSFSSPSSARRSTPPRVASSSDSRDSTPPRVRLPMEEPSTQVTASSPPQNQPAGTESAPKTGGSTPPKALPSQAELPYGTPIPGRPNMVNSPYAGKTQLVDVSGMGPGQTVKCPYTGKLFKVPAAQQAENNVENRLESRLEAPKLSAEPPARESKP